MIANPHEIGGRRQKTLIMATEQSEIAIGMGRNEEDLFHGLVPQYASLTRRGVIDLRREALNRSHHARVLGSGPMTGALHT
jgi:hypothetical protein